MSETIPIRGNTWKPKKEGPSLWRGMTESVEESRQRELEEQEKERNELALIARLAKERQDAAKESREAPWEGKRGVDPSRGGSRPPQTLESLQNFGRPNTTKVPPRSSDGTTINWGQVADSNPVESPSEPPPVQFVSPEEDAAQNFKDQEFNPQVTPGQYESGATDVPMGEGVADQFADAAEEEGELADIDEAALQAAIESGNEGKKKTSGIKTEGFGGYSGIPGADTEDVAEMDVAIAADDLLDDIDGNLNGMMDGYSTKDILEGKVVNDTEEAIQGGGNNEDLFPNGLYPDDQGLANVPEGMASSTLPKDDQSPIYSDVTKEGARENTRMQQVINSYARRIGEEAMGEGGVTRSELQSLAMTAEKEARETGEDPVLAVGRKLRAATMGHFAKREGQRRINYDNMIAQQHKSRRWGVPVALVQAMEVLGAAKTIDERRAAINQLAVLAPNLGKDFVYGKSGVQVSGESVPQRLGENLSSEVSQDKHLQSSFAQLALKDKPPVDETKTPVGTILKLRQGDGTFSADNVARFTTLQQQLQQNPEQILADIATTFPTALKSMKENFTALRTVTEEDKARLRSLFQRALGKKPNRAALEGVFGPLTDEEFKAIYLGLYMERPTNAKDWARGIGQGTRDLVTGTGNAFTGVVEGLKGEGG